MIKASLTIDKKASKYEYEWINQGKYQCGKIKWGSSGNV